jgi:crotonobetainyl-CoA:carnitine CoA-transferase CaiB-like acyl-CoA transferase
MASAFEDILAVRGRERPEAGEVALMGHDPIWPTRFRVSEVVASALAGVGVALNDIHETKTGRRQRVSVDVRHAAAAVKSAYLLQRPDATGTFHDVVNAEHQAMRQMTQPWPTRDGRWFLPHFGLPNLRARVLGVLKCEATPESVGKAVAGWNAIDLETAIAEARACGGMVRSRDEWLAHPHGEMLAAKPIVELVKIGDAEPRPLPKSERLLGGIRVLDLTRILAGPMAARTLAEHGADVLNIVAPDSPFIPEHVTDTNHGKRSCFLDLATKVGAADLRRLLADADVISNSYRPGTLAKFGFAPEELAALRPGIVFVSISCYGDGGPFSHRGGWEQLGQTVTGISHTNDPARPHLLPVPACDYTTGYLAAYGALLALDRRAHEGGSWHVRVSLCRSGMFIHDQGRLAADAAPHELTTAELDALRIESRPHDGPLRHLGPVLRLSETPGRWDRPTPKPGSAPAQWL